MGLLTETNAQYYSGQQVFTQPAVVNQVFNWTGDTDLIVALAGVSNTNFKVLVNNAPITYVASTPGASQYTLSAACLLYTSPSPRGLSTSRMPSSA